MQIWQEMAGIKIEKNENDPFHSSTVIQRNRSVNHFKSANSQSKSKSPEELKSVKYGSLLNQRDTNSQWDWKVKSGYKV